MKYCLILAFIFTQFIVFAAPPNGGLDSLSVDIRFEKGKAEVRDSEWQRERMQMLLSWIQLKTKSRDVKIDHVKILSYSSPDGESTSAPSLLDHRLDSTEIAFRKKLKELGVKKKFDCRTEAMGIDWEGFKQAIEKSDLPDKSLILRILQMYADPKKREEEIKNLSQVYASIGKEIMPTLRRSTVTVFFKEKTP